MNKNNSWSDIEIFKNVRAKVSQPYVIITSRKQIVLSSGFLHHTGLFTSKMTHVILAFSKSKKAIALNFTNNDKSIGALKITKIGSQASKKNNIIGTASISASSFFNYHNINCSDYSAKYIAIKENITDIGDLWVIYLKKSKKK